MTAPGEKEVDVLLAESVRQVEKPVSRELLPLPIPFPENEVVESERMRGLSRAARSRVKRRVGCANVEVHSMSKIFGGGRRRAVCDATLISVTNLRSLSRDKRCRLQFHRGNLQSALQFSAWLHWNWCQTGHLQRGSRFCGRPGCKDGRWLCSIDWLGLRSLERLAPGFAFVRQASFMK